MWDFKITLLGDTRSPRKHFQHDNRVCDKKASFKDEPLLWEIKESLRMGKCIPSQKQLARGAFGRSGNTIV